MSIYQYFLLFMIYSVIGWLIEVIQGLILNKKFVNRGFLIGPYCPIYGWGSIIIILLLKRYINDLLALFSMSVLICSVLEYMTSLLMEVVFHARWWDYSERKFNINGRICLETMIPFGIGGCIIVKFVNPLFEKILILANQQFITILSIIIFIFYLIDNIISFKIIFNLKSVIKKTTKDSTEKINKLVKDVISNKSLLNRRLINAFPKIEVKQKRKNKED
jgi:uncharacterized membrane protein